MNWRTEHFFDQGNLYFCIPTNLTREDRKLLKSGIRKINVPPYPPVSLKKDDNTLHCSVHPSLPPSFHTVPKHKSP